MTNHKKIISISLTIALVGFFAYFLYANQEIFKEIQNINPIYILPIIVLMLIFQYLNGVFLKTIVKPYDINVKEHFHLSISANFLNLITPFKGGTGMRAFYMKKKYNLKYSEFIASMFGNYIIVFLVCAGLGLITFSMLYLLYGIFNLYLFLIFIGVILATITLLNFSFKFKKENFFTKNLNKVLKGWEVVKNHKRIIPLLILLPIGGRLIYAFIIMFTFKGLGIEISFFKALYLSVFQLLSIFVNITPGSLGITESFFYLSSGIINIKPELALLVALIIRSINIIFLLSLGPISNFILFKKLKNTGKSIPVTYDKTI
ncbi:flippase-like domain-containing protein [Candidatus Peregrinibacteria bacterium]|nr:flippase-like domain-containing protein [Candidatus Peregrinibacteria bacterium]